MIPFRCSFSMVNSKTFGAVLGKSRAMVRARFIKYLACEGWIHSFNRWRLAYIVIGTLGECLGAEPNVYFHGIIRVKTRLHLLRSRMVPSCWWWFVRKTPVTFFFLLANSFAVNNCSAPKNKVSPNEIIHQRTTSVTFSGDDNDAASSINKDLHHTTNTSCSYLIQLQHSHLYTSQAKCSLLLS